MWVDVVGVANQLESVKIRNLNRWIENIARRRSGRKPLLGRDNSLKRRRGDFSRSPMRPSTFAWWINRLEFVALFHSFRNWYRLSNPVSLKLAPCLKLSGSQSTWFINQFIDHTLTCASGFYRAVWGHFFSLYFSKVNGRCNANFDTTAAAVVPRWRLKLY